MGLQRLGAQPHVQAAFQQNLVVASQFHAHSNGAVPKKTLRNLWRLRPRVRQFRRLEFVGPLFAQA